MAPASRTWSKPSSATSEPPASTAAPTLPPSLPLTFCSLPGAALEWRDGQRRAALASIGDLEVHALEGVAGHLRPDAVLLHRDFVHFDVGDLELAALVVQPEVDVVIFVLAAGLAEVGAGEILALLLQVPDRLVHLDEFKRDRLAGLVVLDGQVAARVLMGGDVIVDRAHHVPAADDLGIAGMLRHRQPPPGHGKPAHHHPAVAVALRTF